MLPAAQACAGGSLETKTRGQPSEREAHPVTAAYDRTWDEPRHLKRQSPETGSVVSGKTSWNSRCRVAMSR
jgi:hypothetical protein